VVFDNVCILQGKEDLPMEDFQATVEKLLRESMECDLIAGSATDFKKLELFERLARDYREIAREVEKMAL
jgi:hypothetical protein